MSESSMERAPTPWHLWAIGGVTLLWNAFGAFDYVMTQTRNAAYLNAYTAEQIDFFANFPVWVDAAWAFGVWGALAGSVLLLLRSRWARAAFGLSLAGMAVSFVHNLAAGAGDLMGPAALVMTGVIIIVAVALFFYAGLMARRGVLR